MMAYVIEIRLSTDIQGSYQIAGTFLRVELGGPHTIEVVFDAPSKAVAARGRWSPSDKNRQWLDTVLAGKARGTEPPDGYLAFADSCRQDLISAIRRVFGLLRWRYNVDGGSNPFLFGGTEWSADGNEWNHMGTTIRAELSFSASLPLTERSGEEVQRLLGGGRVEPVQHEILRTAIAATNDDARSALVMGVTALEVGIKKLIGALIPEARWIVEESPTPPVLKMLTELLPKLDLHTKLVRLPRDKLALIRKAVEVRNRLIHSGRYDMQRDDLRRFLDTVGDLLWIFEFYSGSVDDLWSLEHVKEKNEFGIVLTYATTAESASDV